MVRNTVWMTMAKIDQGHQFFEDPGWSLLSDEDDCLLYMSN